MDDFINVIKKDLQIQDKINDLLDRYMRLPLKYQSKISYDSSIQNVILKGLKNILATTMTDLGIKLKIKISRKKNLKVN